MKAGLSRNRRCSALGRRGDSFLGLTAAEASGAVRPIEISGDGRGSDAGAIPVGTGWLIEEAEAPNCGELTEGTALTGVMGGEGGVGFLINVWGTTGWGLDWVWPGTRASFRVGEVSGGCWIKL